MDYCRQVIFIRLLERNWIYLIYYQDQSQSNNKNYSQIMSIDSSEINNTKYDKLIYKFKHNSQMAVFSLQLLTLLLLLYHSTSQCPTSFSLITVYYLLSPTQVCIPTYSVIKHCLSYWTSTPVQTYAKITQFQCRKCAVYTNEQFIISLVTLSATSSNYYLSCIPNSLKTINCEYYIQKVFPDNTATFECGGCPARYPNMVKGLVNQFSFCIDKPVTNCISYGQAGLDRIGFTKVKCDICEARYSMDFVNNKCLGTVDNCANYDYLRKCTQCNNGYSLVNELCSKPDQQSALPSTPQSNTPQSTAKTPSNQPIQQPCLQFSRRSLDICVSCKPSYTLWNGQCFICPDGSYINSKGQCISGQFPNCGSFNQQGLCLNCKENYRFSNDLTACVSVVPVKKCPENTPRFKYVLMNGQCVGVDINCQENAFGINGCFDCKPGFYVWEGVCYFYR